MSYSLGNLLSESLKNKGIKQSQFAEIIGVDPSFLSRVLRGDKPIPLASLDKSIYILNLDEDECYSLYLEECFAQRKKGLSLITKYIVHCVEEGKNGHADNALGMILETGGLLSAVFSVGEELFQKGLKQESIQFFHAIVTHENDRRSSLLAMSYYRILLTHYETNSDKSEEAAHKLSEYLDYVPDDEILEAHYKVVSTYRIKHKWEYVLVYGKKLVRLAKEMDRLDYVGDALIKMAIAAREMGNLKLALKYHKMCLEIPIGNYSRWAEGNILITLIAFEQKDKVIELFNFCERNKDLAYEYLEVLISSAVKYNFFDLVERIFVEFSEQIAYLESIKGKHSIYDRHLINFTHAKALYHLKIGNLLWIQEAFLAATMAIRIKLHKQALSSLKLVLGNADKSSSHYNKALNLIDEIDC
ncbi:MAG TPA: helix-turn-helix transcriptional regulator [Candidatus Bathyarchaeia archaeon]|nr:helix-turn-helix transcriptional regulator [Candidatus Bathyarchaeia archaeon]